MTPADESVVLAEGEDTLRRLVALRASLTEERHLAPTPAVARALEMTDYYLFLALTYVGYHDTLYPEEP